jgi:crotonobetainyl-CoA:carnitine CoA-transferase CaiB-like acyl-CoA transferase
LKTQHQSLRGIRVLEFTHAVMGPSAGLILADLGAEIIRIEPSPQGDHTRRLKGFGTGYYTFFNRNKKSLAVNLKTAAGLEIANKLLDTADALIENFAPGTMDRLGLGYETISSRNPRLIYCSLKGFMDGPYANRTALDEVVQMMSGLAYMTGPPGQPLRAGASIVDIMGGAFGAIAVLSALRERDETGEGQFVQTGLFETAAFIMGQHMAYAAISQQPVPPMSIRISPWAVYRLFTTRDSQLVFIGITSDKHWAAFCKFFNRSDLLANENLATNSQRVEARDWLHPELERFFSTMTLGEIVAGCEAARIPFSPIARPEDLFEDPHLNTGGSLNTARMPDGHYQKLPRLPLAFNGERLKLHLQAPEIGEQSLDILSEIGYSQAEIAAFESAQVVVTAD